MPFLYEPVHKLHHEFKTPFAFMSTFGHPVESILGTDLPSTAYDASCMCACEERVADALIPCCWRNSDAALMRCDVPAANNFPALACPLIFRVHIVTYWIWLVLAVIGAQVRGSPCLACTLLRSCR